MSDCSRPSASPFVRELLRLNAAQVAAKKAGDQDRVNDIADDVALLLRYNATGRLDEYFALRAAQQDRA